MTDQPMRRLERAVDAPADIQAIIEAVQVCRVGFVADGEPYVVPLNFGYEPAGDHGPARFWFHSARDGRKARLLADGPRVCVQLEEDRGLVTHPDKACAWTQAFRSVMAWGRARVAIDADEARHGLDVLMRHHAGRDGWTYPDPMLAQTLVWCVEVDRCSAKQHLAKVPDA
jgi:nitroimidazol reductase NimA-like FMN-containing flavoprotein (pyridoxamine 5'-phosphate oxidase superfamily)